ncbi:D-arabinono-1,4-lactone oxidase [Zavarzinia compransoris]|uniref:D-arabinono-1,4-lactone oxidase n=1 Tax=Zavarzinia compransoris TaxID=1264899 RepID=UPI0010EB0207|nr:D-arabinono-1,4-lactone oxidase [Zavarzinia compransoris]TDP48232.1 FAD-linked oxidoreductase [Zavarzinia compransoris]
MTAPWRNWSGLQAAQPALRFAPREESGIVAAVREAGNRGLSLRAVGAGHSFTPLCVTGGAQIHLGGHAGLVAVEGRQATVRAGTTIRALGPLLRERGLNLANQGDIDAQAIAGAVGTGTHGTGVARGCLSSQVAALRLVTASGEIVECSADREPDVFQAARVALGTVGILSTLTLDCLPAYRLRETRRIADLDDVIAGFEAEAADHTHAEFFWFPLAERAVVKRLDATTEAPSGGRRFRDWKEMVLENGALFLFGRASRLLPALAAPLARLSTAAGGGGGYADHAELVFPSPRLVRFNEMEYAVPADRGPDCIAEIRAWFRRTGTRVYFPIEYRRVAADDIWLSPFQGRDSATIAVHRLAGEDFAPYFAAMEAIFANHRGRPHWGKLHGLKARQLADLYPDWGRFHDLRRRLDPAGLFLNEYLRGLFEA